MLIVTIEVEISFWTFAQNFQMLNYMCRTKNIILIIIFKMIIKDMEKDMIQLESCLKFRMDLNNMNHGQDVQVLN